LGEDADRIVDEIEQFLTGTRAVIEPDRVLATVMFTDIVGSTRHASELGGAGTERRDCSLRTQIYEADARNVASRPVEAQDKARRRGSLELVGVEVGHRPQSSSASRLIAGVAGFFILSHAGERPDRVGHLCRPADLGT
jgi:hypothetical protein